MTEEEQAKARAQITALLEVIAAQRASADAFEALLLGKGTPAQANVAIGRVSDAMTAFRIACGDLPS